MEQINITPEILQQMKTKAGGFTKATIECLGLNYREVADDRQLAQLVGRSFPKATIDAAIDARSTRVAPSPVNDYQYWFLASAGYSHERIERLSSAKAHDVVEAIKLRKSKTKGRAKDDSGKPF